MADDRGSNPLVFFIEDNSIRRQCKPETFALSKSMRESVCIRYKSRLYSDAIDQNYFYISG
jgi:hypothetical protein